MPCLEGVFIIAGTPAVTEKQAINCFEWRHCGWTSALCFGVPGEAVHYSLLRVYESNILAIHTGYHRCYRRRVKACPSTLAVSAFRHDTAWLGVASALPRTVLLGGSGRGTPWWWLQIVRLIRDRGALEYISKQVVTTVGLLARAELTPEGSSNPPALVVVNAVRNERSIRSHTSFTDRVPHTPMTNRTNIFYFFPRLSVAGCVVQRVG